MLLQQLTAQLHDLTCSPGSAPEFLNQNYYFTHCIDQSATLLSVSRRSIHRTTTIDESVCARVRAGACSVCLDVKVDGLVILGVVESTTV